jgi:hypothetical protein
LPSAGAPKAAEPRLDGGAARRRLRGVAAAARGGGAGRQLGGTFSTIMQGLLFLEFRHRARVGIPPLARPALLAFTPPRGLTAHRHAC